MSESEEEQSGQEETGTVEDPVQTLLAGWGLRAGRAANGWKLDSVSLDLHSPTACIDFSRNSDNVRVRAKPAGDDPSFDRVGAIAISHDAVDESLNEDVALTG